LDLHFVIQETKQKDFDLNIELMLLKRNKD